MNQFAASDRSTHIERDELSSAVEVDGNNPSHRVVIKKRKHRGQTPKVREVGIVVILFEIDHRFEMISSWSMEQVQYVYRILATISLYCRFPHRSALCSTSTTSGCWYIACNSAYSESMYSSQPGSIKLNASTECATGNLWILAS